MAEKHQTFDPGRQQIGTVYAKALVAAAEKAGQTDQVLGELEGIVADILDKLPRVEAALSSPRLAHEDKVNMIDRAFTGKVAPTLLNFLKVLSRHGRLDCLRAVAQAARKLVNEIRGRVDVELRTAVPVSNPLREAITARLSAMLGKEVIVNAKVDPELLGGMVVRVGDTLYDGSLASKLTSMRSQAVERTASRMRESLGRFAST